MLSETAYAKVNLALHVRGRRADGYHDIETVFAFCEGGDVVTAVPSDALALTIDGRFAAGLSTTDNLVIRAAQALGVTARLHLSKRLPVASGIGGGSADAAAVLRMFGTGRNDLYAIAAQLGADVPACLGSATVRGKGVGDVFEPALAVSGTPVLLVNPRVPLSTAQVFGGWDGVDRGQLRDWKTGRNDLEAPARAILPVIGRVLDWLAGCPGATTVRMSGSGATCFALFDSWRHCDMAAFGGMRDEPEWWWMASRLR